MPADATIAEDGRDDVAAPRTRRAGATEPSGLPAVFTLVLERPSPGLHDN